MSNMEKELNAKYSALCQQLGDAVLKREQLDKHITDIKLEIETLNKTFPILTQLLNKAQKETKES